jgi:hypothetical protein
MSIEISVNILVNDLSKEQPLLDVRPEDLVELNVATVGVVEGWRPGVLDQVALEVLVSCHGPDFVWRAVFLSHFEQGSPVLLGEPLWVLLGVRSSS